MHWEDPHVHTAINTRPVIKVSYWRRRMRGAFSPLILQGNCLIGSLIYGDIYSIREKNAQDQTVCFGFYNCT